MPLQLPYWIVGVINPSSMQTLVKAKCLISDVEELRVAAANGKEMSSTSACLQCHYSIQEHNFISDFKLLEVQGYDIILGADWIFKHSLVGLDLRRRELFITKEGEQLVKFSDETYSSSSQIIGTKKLCHLLKKKAIGVVVVLNNLEIKNEVAQQACHPEIRAILSEFVDVFQEPKNLPP
jgi:hypothetical protein